MKEKMNKAGYSQGDMKPKVEDYQAPKSTFSQEGFSRTNDYIERQDSQQSKNASSIKAKAFKGRYS